MKSNHRAHVSTLFSNFYKSFSDPCLKQCLVVAREKGASSWLTALPIVEHGLALHNGAFIDTICLRYGWTPPHLPSHCILVSSFNIDHAMNCKCGGFTSICHKLDRAFFDVRVYNPFSTTYIRLTHKTSHRRNEQEKRKQCDSRICTVEHGTFTSLVFTTAGGMGPAATTFCKHLASNLSDHHKNLFTCFELDLLSTVFLPS